MDRAAFETQHGLFAVKVQRHPINVDDISTEERAALIEHPAVHLEVKRYAQLKQFAVERRLAGDITAASRAEAKLERIYETLPRNLRW